MQKEKQKEKGSGLTACFTVLCYTRGQRAARLCVQAAGVILTAE